MCALINSSTTIWSNLLAATYANFFPNETATDPVPVCNCMTVPCEPGNHSPLQYPRIVYDYTAVPPPPVPNITVEPVCRMDNTSIGLYLSNLPPLPNLNGNPGDYVTTPLSIANPWLNRLVPPFTLSSPNVVYETSPLGVLWRINNNEVVLNLSSIAIRWEFGEFVPPSGTTAGEIISVPYTPATATDVSLHAGKSLWVFSRTPNPHKLYGNAQLPCGTPAECAAVVPQDPAPGSWGPAHTLYGQLDDPSTLPPCECFVNFPCNASQFLGITELDVNVSELVDSPPPTIPSPVVYVPIYPNCTPNPEVCNGLDDNCNGIVDDLPGFPEGVGDACSTFYEFGTCAANPGTLACNLTSGTVICIGQVLPSDELCDLLDHNCDGIPGNVPGLGELCGSDLGICVKGTLTCVPGNLTAQCVGGVAAEPAEICANGLDDDCNGLIDDGCPDQPVVATPVIITPVPVPTPVPPPTVLPAPGPNTLESIWDSFLEAIGFTPNFGPFSVLTLIFVTMLMFCFCLACAIIVCRQDMTRRRFRRANGYQELKDD
jgi:hypothetical protein